MFALTLNIRIHQPTTIVLSPRLFLSFIRIFESNPGLLYSLKLVSTGGFTLPDDVIFKARKVGIPAEDLFLIFGV
ncbi:hypothetical protein A1QC_03270 [Vibrio rumoiensis 1S-45]|uniref:Uncharacterized protein n=1 Tax=Vibrio rumoiensis 1S-45 TaxID=1188252 RepID=A0A1E5E6E6_9VIBR|nr:hypothetical protein A1QC_03270 [Vibrio rumoiensis 1S-45]